MLVSTFLGFAKISRDQKVIPLYPTTQILVWYRCSLICYVMPKKEFKHLTSNLTKLHNKYKNEVQISFIFDKNMITGYKSSPIDEGKEKFLQLFKERIFL